MPGTAVASPGSCTDLLRNGGFEESLTGWWPGLDPIPVSLVAAPTYEGGSALLLGSTSAARYSYSSVSQQVYIPTGYDHVSLSYWTHTWTSGSPGADHQEAAFLSPRGRVVQKLWRVLVDDREWVQHDIPVDDYQGRTIIVYFNVVTGTAGGQTGMYLDDVHLWACGPAVTAGASAPDVSAGQTIFHSRAHGGGR